MGLLDTLLNGTGDPQRDAAINRGLLQAGLALMQSRGKLFPALGQAGLAGLQAGDQVRQQQRAQERAGIQDRMLKNQLAEQERQQQIAALPGQFAVTAKPDTMDNRDVGQPGEAPVQQGFDMLGYINALMAKAPQQALALQAAMQKERPGLMNVAPGGSVFDPASGKPVYTAPFKPAEAKPTGLAQLMAERDALPEGDPRRRAYDDAIKKETTASAGVQVSYGQPVAGVDPEGRPVFFQPDRGGGTPSIIPGVKPAPQNRDTKLPAEIQRMNIAADTMGSMLNRYEEMLKKYNPRDPVTQANPAIRAEFQSLMKAIQLQFKEVQALGALAGPDLEIMEAAITDPFTMKGAYYGRDGLRGQIRQARELLKERRAATAASQGQQATGAPSASGGPTVIKFDAQGNIIQ